MRNTSEGRAKVRSRIRKRDGTDESPPAVSRAELVERLGPGNYSRIARVVRLSQQHVSRVLRGKSDCSFRAAYLISQAANVSLDDLFKFLVHYASAYRIDNQYTRSRKVFAFSAKGSHRRSQSETSQSETT